MPFIVRMGTVMFVPSMPNDGARRIPRGPREERERRTRKKTKVRRFLQTTLKLIDSEVIPTELSHRTPSKNVDREPMSGTCTGDEVFIPIAVVTLTPSTVTPFSVYVRDADSYRLFRDANYPFEVEDRNRLLGNGVTRLYVTHGDLEQYKAYLRAQLRDFLGDESLPARDRLGGLDEVVRNVLQEDFASRSCDRIVNSAKELAEHTVQAICNVGAVASDLLSVMHHDYQTFTHSANVTYLSVLLASKLGLAVEDLRLIAAGALLHDLGKLHIPERILNKNGSLDIVEFAAMKQHPIMGFEMLGPRSDLTWGQLMMVYQHHENWKGNGYPVGSVGAEIHLWARICTLADVFEALTADRPYRRSMTIAQALDIMGRRMHDKFEPELLQCFRTAIHSS